MHSIYFLLSTHSYPMQFTVEMRKYEQNVVVVMDGVVKFSLMYDVG